MVETGKLDILKPAIKFTNWISEARSEYRKTYSSTKLSFLLGIRRPCTSNKAHWELILSFSFYKVKYFNQSIIQSKIIGNGCWYWLLMQYFLQLIAETFHKFKKSNYFKHADLFSRAHNITSVWSIILYTWGWAISSKFIYLLFLHLCIYFTVSYF